MKINTYKIYTQYSTKENFNRDLIEGLDAIPLQLEEGKTGFLAIHLGDNDFTYDWTTYHTSLVKNVKKVYTYIMTDEYGCPHYDEEIFVETQNSMYRLVRQDISM